MRGDNNLVAMQVPVHLLLFNRPETTKRVFEAIRAAQPACLYVAAEGSRSEFPGDIQGCQNVRQIATAVDWQCNFKTLFRDRNFGSRKAMGGAVT